MAKTLPAQGITRAERGAASKRLTRTTGAAAPAAGGNERDSGTFQVADWSTPGPDSLRRNSS